MGGSSCAGRKAAAVRQVRRAARTAEAQTQRSGGGQRRRSARPLCVRTRVGPDCTREGVGEELGNGDVASTFPDTLQLREVWQRVRHVWHCVEVQRAQDTGAESTLSGTEATVLKCHGPCVGEDVPRHAADECDKLVNVQSAARGLQQHVVVRLRQPEFELREDVGVKWLQGTGHRRWDVAQTKAGASGFSSNGRGEVHRAH